MEDFRQLETSLWMTLSTAICGVGLIGNIFSIFLIIILKEWKTSIFNLMILHLAVADLILLLTLPLSIHETLFGWWSFPDLVCRFHRSVLQFNCYASVLLLAIISMERYISICKNDNPTLLRLQSRSSVVIILCLVWVFSITATLPIFLNSTTNEINGSCGLNFDAIGKTNIDNQGGDGFPESIHLDIVKAVAAKNNESFYDVLSQFNELKRNMTNMTPDEKKDIYAPECVYQDGWMKNLVILNFIFGYSLPVMIMSLAYGMIIRQVRLNRARLRRQKQQISARSTMINTKVVTTSIILVLTFAICWAPLHSYHIARTAWIPFDPNEGFRCKLMFEFSRLFIYLNSALNPFIYSFFATNFTKRCRDALSVVKSTFH